MHFVLKIEQTLSDLEYKVCRRSRSDFNSDVSCFRHRISKRTSLFLANICLKRLFFWMSDLKSEVFWRRLIRDRTSQRSDFRKRCIESETKEDKWSAGFWRKNKSKYLTEFGGEILPEFGRNLVARGSSASADATSPPRAQAPPLTARANSTRLTHFEHIIRNLEETSTRLWICTNVAPKPSCVHKNMKTYGGIALIASRSWHVSTAAASRKKSGKCYTQEVHVSHTHLL